MTDLEIRKVIVEALEYASVYALRHQNLKQGFLDGADVPLDQLDIDSLAAMELCIALELDAGISIVPENLEEIGSLNRLVELVARSKT